MKRFNIRLTSVALLVLLCLIMCSCSGGSSRSSDNYQDDEEETIESVEQTDDETSGEETEVASDFDPDFTFTTEDREGNTWDESVFAEHDLTMINFWEPWCGPCVSEMPELAQLYNDYSERGLLIIGVYSDMAYEDDVNDILDSSSVKYPILHYTAEFDPYQSGYVPTTIFVDREGHVVTPDGGEMMTVGSNSYEGWAEIIEDLL